uniref:Si:ch211-255i20.3 n=1 Tax=Erpetoichthys calabaricus TaxID=27687 RepID=A0A8C4T513_ERPCA
MYLESYIKTSLIKVALILVLFSTSSFGMFFHLGEREEKCIIEDIPDDTLVSGYFHMEQLDVTKQNFHSSKSTLGMVLTVRDPEHDIVISKLYGFQGKFTFTSHSPGNYYICLKSNSTRLTVFAGNEMRVHLDIQIGKYEIGESVPGTKDAIHNARDDMQHILEQLQQINKQQNYQREREETFRQISENTNSNILWWAAVQTTLLLIVGMWQTKQLKDFLIEKKLV